MFVTLLGMFEIQAYLVSLPFRTQVPKIQADIFGPCEHF